MRTPLFLVLTLCTSGAMAKQTVSLGEDWNLTLDGQYRARLVVDSNRADLKDTGIHEREFVTQRARIGVTVANAKDVSFTLRLQDVRMWGESSNTLNDFHADGFDAHEAFLNIPLYKGASVKLGRQEIVFDNSRLMGNVDWVMRGRSFDGGRASWRGKTVDADVFLVMLSEGDLDGDRAQQPDPAAPARQAYLAGLHADYKHSKALKASLAFYSRDNNASEEKRHTAGVVVKGTASGAHYSVEGYKQFGDLGDESIDAFMAALQAGYTLKGKMAPGITVWGELLSGDKDGKPEAVFDTLYATNHKFYGEMDYFLAIGPHTTGRGLMDVGGKAQFKPTGRSSAHVAVHSLSLAEEDPAGEKALGNEIDLKGSLKLANGVKLGLFYGLFMPGKAMETVRGVQDPENEHLIYVDTIFGF